jgi:hypothetical protein
MKILKKLAQKFANAVANNIKNALFSVEKDETELLALGSLLSNQQWLPPPPPAYTTTIA